MCRVIDRVGDYKILKALRDYIVKNVRGDYSNHGHFKRLKTCKNYVNKVKHKIQKDKDKQKYININKGCR